MAYIPVGHLFEASFATATLFKFVPDKFVEPMSSSPYQKHK